MSDKARRAEAENALIKYYEYMNQSTNGFPANTITGKLVKDGIGQGGKTGSSIPKGVRMTDPHFLKWVNKMDLIMDNMADRNIKDNAIGKNRAAFDYIVYRYSEGLKNKKIIKITKYSESTCKRLHKEALEIISVRL